MRKIFYYLLVSVVVVSIPIIVFTATTAGLYATDWLQDLIYRFSDVSSSTGLTLAELSVINDETQAYIFGGDELINISVLAPDGRGPLFNAREIEHMRDVKGLIRLATYSAGIFIGLVLALSLVGGFVLKRKVFEALAVGVKLSITVAIPVLLVLGVVGALNFNWLFTTFHQLAFTNDLWLLNPNDYMLRIYPTEFWVTASIVLLLLMTLELTVLWWVTRLLRVKFSVPKVL